MFDPSAAARAEIGTPVPDREMPTLDGAKARMLQGAAAEVLVFFRPGQARSAGALRELAECQKLLAGKSVRWTAIVSGGAPAGEVAALISQSQFAAQVLVDEGDALYGSLGVAMHPVLVVVDRDRRLAAFEPFRSIDYCPVVAARIRHLLGEISDRELQAALAPPRAAEGGNGEAARRYRALAQALLKAGNHDKALEAASKGVERDAAYAAGHVTLGDVLAAKGECARALESYRRALALDSGNDAASAGLERCKSSR